MTQEGFLTTLMEVDAFDSPAQAFTSEDGVPNARGRVLGGETVVKPKPECSNILRRVIEDLSYLETSLP